MCGILGAVRPGEAVRARFPAALDSIAHRGPDGAGIFADEQVMLGHRRLAIIDLHPRGHQPMTDPATGATMVYNGEIYNYLELRDELRAAGEVFATESDSEVLLRGYLRWGPAALSRMNGMWALAIWEPAQNRLFAARDRFGVKPFYHAGSDGAFLFASEPKALLALDPTLAEPNPEALHDLFAASRMHAGTATFFRRIEALAPGSWMMLDAATGNRRCGRFWDYPSPEPAEAERDTPEAFAAIFDDAVRLRLRSDVEVGLTLSGGLDSSAVLAGAQHQGAAMRCFTSVYSDARLGELRWAERAAALGSATLEPIPAETSDWLPTLERVVWHMDSPGYSPAVFPLWQIMRAARKANVPVLLEGQGADELLAGYPQYVPLANSDLLQQDGVAGLGAAARNFAGSTRAFGAKGAVLWSARAALPSLSNAWRRRAGGAAMLNPDVLPAAAPDLPPVAERSALHTRLLSDFRSDVLPALLHYGDAVSMAHGIESRLPFLDYRLVEWVFRSQPRLISGGRTKQPVRRYLEQRGFGAIAARPDKRGYPTPVDKWLSERAQPMLRDQIASPNAEVWQWFDRSAVSAMIDRSAAGNAGATFHLYKFLTVVIWLAQLGQARTTAATADADLSPPRAVTA